MFSATYFTYDGVFSGEYGLMIADFNDSSVDETAAFSPSFTTHKIPATHRFLYGGMTYDSHPTYQFSVISETEISDIARRKILSWLVGRNEFKIFQLHQPMSDRYYYKCVFSDTQIIYVNGRCHGFRLTANFDSPYQYGTIVEKSFEGNEANGYSCTVEINNKSDILDAYTYPILECTMNSSMQAAAGSPERAYAIRYYRDNNILSVNGEYYYGMSVHNASDPNGNNERYFILTDSFFDSQRMVSVDNDIRRISGDMTLENFNKNWIRLMPGINEIQIKINGSGKIKYVPKMMIGF